LSGDRDADADAIARSAAVHHRRGIELARFAAGLRFAAQLAAHINYVSPVAGVGEELAKIDPRLARNPLIVPDKAMQEKSHAFRSLDQNEETAFEEKFER